MGALLPFGQPVIIRHKFLEFEKVWITSAKPSYFVGGDWQYEVRTDQPLKFGSDPDKKDRFLFGGDWFDEADIEPIKDGILPMRLNIPTPDVWPPRTTRVLGRRGGMWVSNGYNDNVPLMLDWLPGALTSFDEYLPQNGVFGYKADHPEIPVIIRFQHHQNWQDDPKKSAIDLGQRVASKWDEIKVLDPYVYFANEMNLHNENGDPDVGNQHLYETKEFYQKYADWVRITADTIKNIVPEMKLVTPPFAFGHFEDGEPDDDGKPKAGWAGYDYLVDTIKDYFDNILTFHAYWGDSSGRIPERLYDPELSSWYAFRWRRVLKLFEAHYNIPAKMIIDEAGSFQAGHPEFFDDIRYYSEQCLSDERVLALTYFLWNDPTNSPGNVPNSWVHNISDLPGFVAKLKALPDAQIEGNEPEPEPPPEPEPQPDPEPEPDPEPPPGPAQNVKMIVEHGKGLPLIVGNWFKAGESVELELPWGTVNKTITGAKAEYGPGGFEAGYAAGPGEYKLRVGGYTFKFDMPAPPTFTRLSFEQTGPPVELQARLVSSVMTAGLAEGLVAELELKYPGVFEVEVI